MHNAKEPHFPRWDVGLFVVTVFSCGTVDDQPNITLPSLPLQRLPVPGVRAERESTAPLRGTVG